MIGRCVNKCGWIYNQYFRSPRRRHSDSYRSRREEKPSQPVVTNVSTSYLIVGLNYKITFIDL